MISSLLAMHPLLAKPSEGGYHVFPTLPRLQIPFHGKICSKRLSYSGV